MENRRCNLENLIVTDDHDLDITIFRSNALETYLDEFADKAKLQAFKTRGDGQLVAAVFCAVNTLAYCRWASERSYLMLDFKRLDFSRFIDRDSLTCNDDALMPYLIQKSPAATCTETQLRGRVRGLRSDQHVNSDLCNGHDANGVLGIALQAVVANYRPMQVTPKLVEADLRLSFDFYAFLQTTLYE